MHFLKLGARTKPNTRVSICASQYLRKSALNPKLHVHLETDARPATAPAPLQALAALVNPTLRVFTPRAV